MCLCKQWSADMSMGVCMCVSSSTKSPVDSYLCVCVLSKHFWKGRKCAHQMCVCSCTRKIKGGHECVCVCPASWLSRQQLLVCVCVYMYANTAEWLRLHKAVILLLIMKYFVLKMISYSHTTAPCNFLSNSRKKKSNTFTWYANYFPTVNNEGGVVFFVSVTNEQTDGRTDRPTLFWNLAILTSTVYDTLWLLE